MRPSEQIERDAGDRFSRLPIDLQLGYEAATKHGCLTEAILKYLDEQHAPAVKFKLVREGAQLPNYQTEGASCMDLHAVTDSNLLVRSGGHQFVGTGVAVELPEGFDAQVRGRSGLARRGVLVHLGTIDSDYRGEIGLIVYNIRSEPFTIHHGDRIAQLAIVRVARARAELVDELSPTTRGASGYGSTGR